MLIRLLLSFASARGGFIDNLHHIQSISGASVTSPSALLPMIEGRYLSLEGGRGKSKLGMAPPVNIVAVYTHRHVVCLFCRPPNRIRWHDRLALDTRYMFREFKLDIRRGVGGGGGRYECT